MATTIKLKNGSGAPLAGDLVQGEPAFDLTNKRLYTEDSGGTVIEVGTNPTSLTTGTFTSTGIDDNATSTAITIDSSENVGIGTASPVQLLDVGDHTATGDRSIRISQRTATAAQTYGGIEFFYDNSAGTTGVNAAIKYAAGPLRNDGELTFHTGASASISERLRIDHDGNLGLGNNDPSSYSIDTGPDIIIGDGTDNPHLSIVSPTDGTGYVAFADGTTGNEKYRGLIEYAHSTDHMGLRTAGSERMRIDSSGNVGIGTTSVTSGFKMEVLGDVRVGDAVGDDAVEMGWSAGSSQGFIQAYDRGASAFRALNLNNAVTITSAGNVGIGTTSPQFQLHLSGSAPGVVMSETAAVKYYRNRAAASALTWDILNTDYSFNSEVMRIDSSGNVGIGTDSPQELLHLRKDASAVVAVKAQNNTTNGIMEYQAGNDADNWFFGIDASDNFGISDVTGQASQRLIITQAGNLLVGTTTSRGRITSEASSGFCFDGYITTSSAGQDIFVIRSDVGGTANANLIIEANGDVQNTNNSYGSISDERLKSNIVDASSQIDDIMAVQVRSYTLDSTGDTHIGVVAQELEAAGMSGLVKTNDEGMKSVKYSILYMKALKALQEAVTRIETLEAEVAALKGA